jgi:hypothetical protein
MFTSDPTPATSAVPANVAVRVRRTDTECRARARAFLTSLIGATPVDVTWDRTHRLQGHARLGGRQLVVIAPRDDDHRTVVLTIGDWEQVRRADGDQRRSLLGALAIADRGRLAAVLAGVGLAVAA